MKKALFIIVLVLVMAATVAPARSAQWDYVYITFTGYTSEGGESTFNLLLEYEVSSGTKLNIRGTLLIFEQGSIPPIVLAGSGDIEPDGTIESFNVTGNSSCSQLYYTFDFNFIMDSKNANVTMTYSYPSAFGGTVTENYVYEGTWVFRSCS